MFNRAKSIPISTGLLTIACLCTNFLFLVQPSIAQSWDDLANRGLEARRAMRLKEAEKLLEAALLQAEQFDEQDARLTASLRSLATVYWLEGKYPQAERLFERELNILEKLGEYYHASAFDLLYLGKIKERKGDYAHAQELYEKALAVKEKSNNKGDDEEVEIIWQLARNFKEQGKYDQAEIFYKRGLALRSIVSPKNPRKCEEVKEVAIYYDFEQKYKESEPLYRELTGYCQKKYGARDPQTLIMRVLLGRSLYHQGKTVESKKLCAELLPIAKQWCGEHSSDPTIAEGLASLGSFCLLEKNPEQAKKLLEAAFAIDERSVGPNARETGSVLSRLGGFYFTQHKYPESLSCFKKALAICERQPDSTRAAADLCWCMVGVYCQQNQHLKAEPLLSRVLTVYAGWPERRKEYLRALELYVVLLERTDRKQQASEVTAKIQSLQRQAGILVQGNEGRP
jgi:tetratricopeptide (TPR) repeat protein